MVVHKPSRKMSGTCAAQPPRRLVDARASLRHDDGPVEELVSILKNLLVSLVHARKRPTLRVPFAYSYTNRGSSSRSLSSETPEPPCRFLHLWTFCTAG